MRMELYPSQQVSIRQTLDTTVATNSSLINKKKLNIHCEHFGQVGVVKRMSKESNLLHQRSSLLDEHPKSIHGGRKDGAIFLINLK